MKLATSLVLLLQLLASCSMMQDDRTNCPTCRNPLHITLRYDYNTVRANMFPDHVEQATVYVVDAQSGSVVDQQTAQNTAASKPLHEPSFGFNFEGLTPGHYRLYAIGLSASDQTFGMTTPDNAEAMSKLQFVVPADAEGQVPAHHLDTIWNTLKPVDLMIPEREPTQATIPLMRLTNDLNIIVFRRDIPADNSHERYDVRVMDENATFNYDNTVESRDDGKQLVYHPFAAWTTETIVSDAVAERYAHYDLSLARLVCHDDARRNARLIITNKEDGHEVVNIDLCYYLALARTAFEMQHDEEQEYLDREYDYCLDFGFERKDDHDVWKYMTISINALSWSLRIQNTTL